MGWVGGIFGIMLTWQNLLYGVIGYHVTLSEGHMIANHPI